MTRRGGLLACLCVLGIAMPASAQFFAPINPYGFGAGYTRFGPHGVFHVGFGTRGLGFGPGFFPGCVAPWGFNSFRQTTVIINPPAFNPFTGWPVFPRGVLVDPLALQVLPPAFFGGPVGNRAVDREIDRMREALPQPPPDPNRGLFVDREQDRIEVKIDRQAPPVRRPPIALGPVPAVPAMPPAALEVPRPQLPPVPLADPKAEYQRLILDGKAAFARGAYGRAAERFGQAIDLRPADAAAWFLRSQAGVALGKYLDAADDLREGLTLAPAGLLAGFVVADLYGPKAADYADHRRLLEQTRTRFAGDVNLARLAAVQCWLAGDRAEARARMDKFEGAERRLVASFLAAGALAVALP